MTAPVIALTRKHYKRLRWFFQSASGAAGSVDNVDLDLSALGLIERVEKYGVVYFKITPEGTSELSAENLREIERRQPHHSLAGRLAQWLRDQGRMTWENIEFRIEVDSDGQIRNMPVRPDVFSVFTTLNASEIKPHVHEVKVSRSDFLADLAKPEKRGSYAHIAEAVYYVAPEGIIDPKECPSECGLIVETAVGFEVSKKPRRRGGRVQLQPSHFMNLIIKPGTANPLF